MQNAQNTEIQQRVINLVELYRTKVGKESDIAKEFKAICKEDEYFDIHSMPQEWIDKFSVNEQLLGHFYSAVAGKEAEKDVLDYLLPNLYDTSIFSDEDEEFLKLHFMELVNYIVRTPTNLELSEINHIDRYVIPAEVLELIDNRVNLPQDAIIYYPNTGLAQLTTLFKGCKFYCDERNAWMKVAIYANNVDATTLEKNQIPHTFDAIVSYLPSVYDEKDDPNIAQLCMAYEKLSRDGKLILLCPFNLLVSSGSDYSQAKLRKMLVEQGAIVEIIQLPQVMSSLASFECFCLIIAEKGRSESTTTMIDARSACQKIDNSWHYMLSFDNEAFNTIIEEERDNPNNGFRQVAKVHSSELRQDMLVPRTYTVERPFKDEFPVPLSKICNTEKTHVYDIMYDLPYDTPWIKSSDLSYIFKGELKMSSVEKANCPNNPGDKVIPLRTNRLRYAAVDSDVTYDDYRTAEYRRSLFLDGTKDAVLYKWKPFEGLGFGLVKASGMPIAVEEGIQVFYPQKGIDVISLLTLLRLPVVYRQIDAYSELWLSHKEKNTGADNYMDSIFVPLDKRIILDEKLRMQKEQDIVGDLEDRLSNKEKSLRMRKHALTQSLSSIKAMFSALNAYRIRKDGHLNDVDVISRIQGTTVQDAFEFINKGILEMTPALEHIADVEYTFTKAESFDPEDFVETFIAREKIGWLNFQPVITWKKGNTKTKVRFPKDALEKIFDNIISNAKAYAFTDDTRKDYVLRFSWHIEGTSLIIEIENNGTAIPDDRDTKSLLDYGVSSALHHDGHNGIGCYEIDSIMRRYKGEVEIISTPKEEFTVKYVLTFKDVYFFT